MQRFVTLVAGPTGVGKTDFVDKLIEKLKKNFPDKKFSIINADVGQFYGPISIGTARPENLQQDTHFLFGNINQPIDITVSQYREIVFENIKNSLSQNIIPIIVGGSGFYLRSLFFPPINLQSEEHPSIHSTSPRLRRTLGTSGDHAVFESLQRESNGDYKDKATQELWAELEQIDPDRAHKIPIGDRYRIERALEIWHTTNIKPSELKPEFNFPFNFKFIYLTRSRPELYKIIDRRAIAMINSGWIEEVKNLDKSWIDFLKVKKIIGYPEIIDFLENNKENTENKINKNGEKFENLIGGIQQKTRNYAKRQETFFRQLVRDLKTEIKSEINEPDKKQDKNLIKNLIIEYNLTLSSVDLYLDELINELIGSEGKHKK